MDEACTSKSSFISCIGDRLILIQPFSLRTFNAPYSLAFIKPFVCKTGNQYSVQASVSAGAKLRYLKGVNMLAGRLWLNNLPLWTSTYCPSLSVSNFSQIIPCRESPQIQI